MLRGSPDLGGCEAKFRWGKTHADRLRNETDEALNTHTYAVRTERDEDAREYVHYTEAVPTISPHWSLVFGDAIHNFRATLDHLVVQLAILGKGGALTEAEVRDTSFPVYDDPGRWTKVAGPGAVSLLRSGERERIRELQPFNAADQSIWGTAALPASGARIPRLIKALHDADIADKHRFVHPSWHAVREVELPPIEGITTAMADMQRLEPDVELGRWGCNPGDLLPDLPPDIDVSRYFPLCVAFGDWGSPYGDSMLDFVDEVEALIGRVIELFRPALTSGEPTPQVTALL